jgi:hypothetical protein
MTRASSPAVPPKGFRPPDIRFNKRQRGSLLRNSKRFSEQHKAPDQDLWQYPWTDDWYRPPVMARPSSFVKRRKRFDRLGNGRANLKYPEGRRKFDGEEPKPVAPVLPSQQLLLDRQQRLLDRRSRHRQKVLRMAIATNNAQRAHELMQVISVLRLQSQIVLFLHLFSLYRLNVWMHYVSSWEWILLHLSS